VTLVDEVGADEETEVTNEAGGRERSVDEALDCPEESCELLVGHEGPHVSIFDVPGLEDQDPRQIWQRWESGEQRVLFRAFPCDEWDTWAAVTGDTEEEPCVLPEGHHGSHRTGRGWWWTDDGLPAQSG
jgi:hypothetical protein